MIITFEKFIHQGNHFGNRKKEAAPLSRDKVQDVCAGGCRIESRRENWSSLICTILCESLNKNQHRYGVN